MQTKMRWSVKDGQALRKARRSFGLSQARLGGVVGVTSSRICEIETVKFPGGRVCAPAQKLADRIAAHLAKLAERAKKRSSCTPCAPDARRDG